MLASAWPSAAKIRPKVKYSYYQTRDFQRGKVIRFFYFSHVVGFFHGFLALIGVLMVKGLGTKYRRVAAMLYRPKAVLQELCSVLQRSVL